MMWYAAQEMNPEPGRRLEDVLESRRWYRWNRWLDERLFEMPEEFNALPPDTWEEVQTSLMRRRTVVDAAVTGAHQGMVLGLLLAVMDMGWWWAAVLLTAAFRLVYFVVGGYLKFSLSKPSLTDGAMSWGDGSLECEGHRYEMPSWMMLLAIVVAVLIPMYLVTLLLVLSWPFFDATLRHGLGWAAALWAITVGLVTVVSGVVAWMFGHLPLVQAFLIRIRDR